MTGTETLERKIGRKSAIRRLSDHIKQRSGFEYKGEQYFRGTWMDKEALEMLEEDGVVVKVGTIGELKAGGFPFPHNELYGEGKNSGIIYKVRDRRINQLLN